MKRVHIYVHIEYVPCLLSNRLPPQQRTRRKAQLHIRRVRDKKEAWLTKEIELSNKAEKEGEALSNTGA